MTSIVYPFVWQYREGKQANPSSKTCGILYSIILFAFMLNLTLINIVYQMNLGALLQSHILTVGILYLILLDYRRLMDFFLRAKNKLPCLLWNSPWRKNLLRLSAIVLPLLFTLYLKSRMQ